MAEVLRFDEWVDLLRERLGIADSVNDDGRLHSFRELMRDYAESTPHQWYWQGEEELSLLGHLHPASTVLNGGDACGRLSPAGRASVRVVRQPA